MADDIKKVEVSNDEIRENFRMLTLRPITQRTLSVGNCIGKVARWHIIEALKMGLMPMRVGNYYLMKADVLVHRPWTGGTSPGNFSLGLPFTL